MKGNCALGIRNNILESQNGQHSSQNHQLKILKNLDRLTTRALARISELSVQKYVFGVNWVFNSFSSHYTQKYGYQDVQIQQLVVQKTSRHPSG